jgi:hypothetical protein
MAVLSEEIKKELLSLKREDITADYIRSLFADYAEVKDGKVIEHPSRINPYDTVTLKAGEYINKTTIKTTAGRIIYNKLQIEPLLEAFGDYYNETLTDGEIEKEDKIVAEALLNDRITPDQFIRYINTQQWIGLTFTSIFCSSLTPGIIAPNKKVIELRDKLYEENKEEIEAGNALLAAQIEKQCVDLAKKELGDDIGTLLYKSGSRGSFGNNYKNISITVGPVFNSGTGKFEIMKNNFMEGISKEDMATSANSVIGGAYPKAIGQRTFGYKTKRITAFMQSVVYAGKGTDCGTKLTIKIKITEKNKKLLMYRYIRENGKTILLDEKNIDKYMGKEVAMRSPVYCMHPKGICQLCIGTMYDKLQIEKIGLSAAKVSSTMSNKSMKKFHDATTKLTRLQLDDLSL